MRIQRILRIVKFCFSSLHDYNLFNLKQSIEPDDIDNILMQIEPIEKN